LLLVVAPNRYDSNFGNAELVQRLSSSDHVYVINRHCEPPARPKAPSGERSNPNPRTPHDGLLRRIRLRPKAGFGGQEGSSQ
jgi:hypothetical protein